MADEGPAVQTRGRPDAGGAGYVEFQHPGRPGRLPLCLAGRAVARRPPASGRAELCVRRHRFLAARGRIHVHAAAGAGHRARSLQRRRPRGQRPAGGRGVLRAGYRYHCLHQVGAPESPGGGRGATPAHAARGAHLHGAGLSRDGHGRVVRHRRAGGPAPTGNGLPEREDKRRHGLARPEGAPGRTGRRGRQPHGAGAGAHFMQAELERYKSVVAQSGAVAQ